jgi:hypothetical protein
VSSHGACPSSALARPTPPLIEPKNGSNQLSFAKALLGSWRPLFLSAGGTVSVVWRTLSSCHSPWIVCRHPFHEGRGGDGRPCRCSITRPLSLASSPSSTSSALNTSAFLLSPGSPLPSLQVWCLHDISLCSRCVWDNLHGWSRCISWRPLHARQHLL